MLRLLTILLWLGPDIGVSFTIDLDADPTGPAADWAIFGIRLMHAVRQVHWNDNLFSTSITDVAGFVIQCWIDNFMAVILQVGRLDATRNRMPTVKEKNFIGVSLSLVASESTSHQIVLSNFFASFADSDLP